MIGSTIGRYKIVERLGAGGMGEVYRAEDTTLGRPVALKFLAAHLLDDHEAKARFLREARAAAAVRHPNICHVYEVGEEDNKTFLAMDYLEGESLEQRIARGPLPLKDALNIGRQIAEGLEAAHEKGVVHRDIKPANVMIDAKGRATILDFGLAKLTEASKLTRAHQTVGTAAYMSPEQIQGAEVDHRTDIWALGCVLYEMVAGLRPFNGQYDQALLYEIVNQEVMPLTAVRTGVPIEVDLFIGKCLAKDMGDRPASAQEVSRELRTLAERLKSGRSTILRAVPPVARVPVPDVAPEMRSTSPVEAIPPDAVVVRRPRLRGLQALTGALAVAFLTIAGIHFREVPPERPVRRFSFAPENLAIEGVGGRATISPNGRYIVYRKQTGGESALWLRSLDDESERQLPGTEGAFEAFWSPDSGAVAFGVEAPDYALKRVSIDGGAPVQVCKTPGTVIRFGAWSRDGEHIVFGGSLQQFYEVASRGGHPRLLFDSRDSPHPVSLYPHFLPANGGPRALVYSAAAVPSNRWVTVRNLETGESRELTPGTGPVYSRDGYLIHASTEHDGRGLWALPFSLQTLEATGDPFQISATGFAPSVSDDGTLVYLDSDSNFAMTLVWRGRHGEVLGTVGQPQRSMADLALSLDGQRAAVTSNEGGRREVWVHDLVRSTKTRLRLEDGRPGERAGGPTWSPSGREIAYNVAARNHIMETAADGSGEPVVLVESDDSLHSPSWSRDGRYLIFYERSTQATRDIRYVEFGTDGQAGEPVIFASSPSNEMDPKLSPDGRVLAYSSDESGRHEIYVRTFPDEAGKWRISINGGRHPRWRSDGKELYYLENATLMAVAVSTEGAFQPGRPQALFDLPVFERGNENSVVYDVSADGQRFLAISPVEGASGKIRIVLNWYEEFRGGEQY